jgi:hypothetical protein
MALSIHTFAAEDFIHINTDEISWPNMLPRVIFYHTTHPSIPCYLYWETRTNSVVVMSNYTYFATQRSSEMHTRDIFNKMNIPIDCVGFSVSADKCLENFFDTPIKELTHTYSLNIYRQGEQHIEPMPLGQSLAPPREYGQLQSVPTRSVAGDSWRTFGELLEPGTHPARIVIPPLPHPYEAPGWRMVRTNATVLY